MPKVTGVFDRFENLEKIPAENIAKWLSMHPDSAAIENYIANRVIYSQTVPVTLNDQNIDFAILREAQRAAPIYFKQNQKKIFIPADFLQITPDIKKLVNIVIDAFEPKGLITFVLTARTKDEILGSLVTVNCKKEDMLYFELEGKNFKIKPGNLTILPCPKDHCHVNFKSQGSTIFGKTELVFEIPGGKIGLIVDGRLS